MSLHDSVFGLTVLSSIAVLQALQPAAQSVRPTSMTPVTCPAWASPWCEPTPPAVIAYSNSKGSVSHDPSSSKSYLLFITPLDSGGQSEPWVLLPSVSLHGLQTIFLGLLDTVITKGGSWWGRLHRKWRTSRTKTPPPSAT